MTIAEKKEVLIFAIHGEGGIVFHDFEIKCGKEIGATERTSRMAAGSAMNHSYDISSDLGGNCF